MYQKIVLAIFFLFVIIRTNVRKTFVDGSGRNPVPNNKNQE